MTQAEMDLVLRYSLGFIKIVWIASLKINVEA